MQLAQFDLAMFVYYSFQSLATTNLKKSGCINKCVQIHVRTLLCSFAEVSVLYMYYQLYFSISENSVNTTANIYSHHSDFPNDSKHHKTVVSHGGISDPVKRLVLNGMALQLLYDKNLSIRI